MSDTVKITRKVNGGLQVQEIAVKPALLDMTADIKGRKVTMRDFLTRAIPYLAAKYNADLSVKQAAGLAEGRQPTKGAHARTLNEVIRAVFPKADPVQVTVTAVHEGLLADRPVKGGRMFYLAADAEGWEAASANKQAQEILADILGA